MSSELLINAGIGEYRMALMAGGRPVEIRLFRDHAPSLVGAIYYGRVTGLSRESQAAFVALGPDLTGFLPLALVPRQPGRKPKDLTSLLTEGQKIMVQVTNDALSDKHLTLTGRIEVISAAMILHPFRPGGFVSSRIKDPDRRAVLKKFVTALDLCGMGLTLRTAAAAMTPETIEKAASHMIKYWQQATENREKKKIPFLLAQGPDSVLQILRDYGHPTQDRIIFDHPAALHKAQGWAQAQAPDMLPLLALHDHKTPLFEYYGVEEALDQILEPKMLLPAGGWISMEQTEAMVVVDVNMGAAQATGQDPDKIRLDVNCAAAVLVFQQLRLRGIGGLVVIDFISMQNKGSASRLLTVVDNLMAQDPMPVQRSGLSAFGLLELTRKSRYRSLHHHLLQPRQPQATIEAQAFSALRQASRDAVRRPGLAVSARVSPSVARWLAQHPDFMAAFTRRTGSPLTIEETP